MQSNLVKIKFQFPNISREIKDKKKFAHLLFEDMQRKGDIKYAGYLREQDFKKDLFRHIGNWNSAQYKLLSVKQKQTMENAIEAAVKKSHKALPHPDLPIFVFVYPWFPEGNDRMLFGGVTALAAYYTIHLFIDLKAYTSASLKQTIAHEWNHLVFYRYHPEHQHTLRAHIVMEGFAELFREEVMGGKPAPWALALTQEESWKQFAILGGKLNAKSMALYKEVFLGSKKYKRWTGYSIAYVLIKEIPETFLGRGDKNEVGRYPGNDHKKRGVIGLSPLHPMHNARTPAICCCICHYKSLSCIAPEDEPCRRSDSAWQ
jgi:uncharacterized protein YjaZ